MLPPITQDFTLFIDRDGVINKEKNDNYILHWSEFEFYPEVKEAFKIFASLFGKIIVVTNQRGVGRGLMSEEDLNQIHTLMQKEISWANGRVDKIYYCTDIDNSSPNRKPNAGMALQAKQDFPNIDFSKAFMVGNKLSDMYFGRNAGITTIFVATTHPETPFPHEAIDYRFDNALEFAKALKQGKIEFDF